MYMYLYRNMQVILMNLSRIGQRNWRTGGKLGKYHNALLCSYLEKEYKNYNTVFT